MIKRISPFSILAIAIGIYCIYVMFADKMGWGFIFALYVIPIALIIWFLDVGLKRLLKTRKKIFGIEILLIIIGIGIYQYGERIKTLEISSKFDKEYVTIVYGVENENKLSISPFTWTKTIEIPNNGMLLTSSSFNTDLPLTKMRFESGIPVSIKESGKGFIQFPESEFESNGKRYKYRSWKIQEGFCCSWSSNESDSLNLILKSEFEKIKASR